MPPRLPHQIGPKLSAPQHLEHVAAIFDQLLWRLDLSFMGALSSSRLSMTLYPLIY
jgi:hypothetical protein